MNIKRPYPDDETGDYKKIYNRTKGVSICPTCHGRGTVRFHEAITLNGDGSMNYPDVCPDCDGLGELDD